MKKDKSYTYEITEEKSSNYDKYDEPISATLKFTGVVGDDSLIYLTPCDFAKIQKNPFSSEKRRNPIEYPATLDYNYTYNLDVPIGYKVIELPRSQILHIDDAGSMSFEFKTSEAKGKVSVRSRLKMSRTFFSQEEYIPIKELYNLIVKKHGEQIVLKKI